MTTVMTSGIVDEVAKAADVPLIRTRVGQPHVVEAMLMEEAVICDDRLTLEGLRLADGYE